ncbi:response regulator [Glaciecola sp. MF2-115]|uniref:response regulator transcription factor n=1 Tax=Glaciecola sp. MF2-115 TaxID=3384827 RepID=UPI0039A1CDB8
MNIIIVDDHSVVREGYKALINMMIPEAKLYEAANGQESLNALKDNDIDLMILDINLAHESGLVLAQQFLKSHPSLKIIFFSMFEDGAILQRAMETGAMGYISKQSDPEVLISAIQVVNKGQKYIEKDLAVRLAKRLLTDQIDIQSRLTAREFEIFIAFAMKKSRVETAKNLDISIKTISNTLTTIKRKLNVEVNEFSDLAIQHGYIGSI